MFNILLDYYLSYALACIKYIQACSLQLGREVKGRVIDLIYDAFVAIQSDGSLILDYDFMMGIFADLQKEMPEFNTYMCVCTCPPVSKGSVSITRYQSLNLTPR